jgi:hypothetical protein
VERRQVLLARRWRHRLAREGEGRHACFAVQNGLLFVLKGEGEGAGEVAPLILGTGEGAQQEGHGHHSTISRHTQLMMILFVISM